MLVSMSTPAWAQLASLGAMETIESIFGQYVTAPFDDASITLRVDLSNPIAQPDELIRNISLLKTHALGAPLNRYLAALQSGQSMDAAKLEIRADTIIYMFPKNDRVTLVYSLDFHNKSDLVIAKVFLNAFVEVRRTMPQAPICAFDVRPPLEMRHFNIEEPTGNVGFLSITVLREHVNSDAKREQAVGLLHMLRNYIQYHIKCSKAYFHQRMRARVIALLQVMNRARMDDLRPNAKKTASGRTFVDRGRESKEN
eukprot:TRINITY_DN6569_c0_g1_i1.p1 TRINITY_DN6569_c0_g1~~TRINITY_DN6569_c0_g1_i1.p1  ORF type:complete len:255 (+),score=86.83 TRINITY_DN6569_c0_g1_i1:193-957(+)